MVVTQHMTATTFWHPPETDRSQTQHRIVLLCPSYVATHVNQLENHRHLEIQHFED